MLDFKGWKKTKEDGKSVTMAHPKGHEMVILLKGIPAIQKEALKRLPLAKGGEIKGVHESAFNYPIDKADEGTSDAGIKSRSPNKEKIGEAKAMHENKLNELKQMPNPKLKGMAEGGVAHYDEGAAPVSQSDVQNNQSVPAGSAPTAVSNTPQPPANYQENSQGQTQDKQVAGAYNQYGQALNSVQQQNQTNRAMIDKAHDTWDKFNADPNNQIQADEYRKNMSLPSKVGTGIGLFLGGFSVPFGGHNFAQDFLDKQIDRNIAAQKENYGHQQNVWGAAKDLFQDNNVADNFAKTAMLDQVNNLVKKSAYASGDPAAEPKAAGIIQNNEIKKEQLKNNSAQILTNKQQAQQKPQSFMDKVREYLPTGGPEAESGTLPSNKPQSNQNSDVDRSIPDVPVPQFQINNKDVMNSQMLGKQGVPNQISPEEGGAVDQELGKVGQFNDKIKLVHQNFGDLWKNRADSNEATRYLSSLGVNLEGIHLQLPNMTTWSPQSREYYRAASRISQELSQMVSSVGLTHEQAQTVLTNLIKQDDSPEDYKKILKQVDENIMSATQTPVLTRHNKIKRPKIGE